MFVWYYGLYHCQLLVNPMHCSVGNVQVRAVVSLSPPGGQNKNISSTFPHFLVFCPILPQIFLSFFLILVFRVGGLPTRAGPGYATGPGCYSVLVYWFQPMHDGLVVSPHGWNGLTWLKSHNVTLDKIPNPKQRFIAKPRIPIFTNNCHSKTFFSERPEFQKLFTQKTQNLSYFLEK